MRWINMHISVVVYISINRYIHIMKTKKHVVLSLNILLIALAILLITSCSSYTYQSNYSFSGVVENSVITNDGV